MVLLQATITSWNTSSGIESNGAASSKLDSTKPSVRRHWSHASLSAMVGGARPSATGLLERSMTLLGLRRDWSRHEELAALQFWW
tara:strand:- start:85 stop:339 length:255 start_codon:yes stop_codon:yes gene_type:complete|eukprot:scaffold25039_cov69-Phaeocystis_antarctica.AAC.5